MSPELLASIDDRLESHLSCLPVENTCILRQAYMESERPSEMCLATAVPHVHQFDASQVGTRADYSFPDALPSRHGNHVEYVCVQLSPTQCIIVNFRHVSFVRYTSFASLHDFCPRASL